MYARPIPSGIIDRVDRASLRQDALRINMKVLECEELAKAIERLRSSAESQRRGVDGEARDLLADVVNLLADAKTQATCATEAIAATITPAMHEVL